MLLLKLESLQYLNSKPPNQRLRYALEVVVLDELIQVDAQALKCNHQVFPEQDKALYSNNVVLVILVKEVQVLQDPELNTCLVLELLLVPDYFEGNYLLGFVV